jgi:hypothetical protein
VPISPPDLLSATLRTNGHRPGFSDQWFDRLQAKGEKAKKTPKTAD